MLTRLVRIQLTLFAIASVVGIAVMVLQYIRVPTLLGIGRIEVTLQLPEAGGLYRFANVTYRGVQIGKVTALDVDRDGAEATLSLSGTPRVPADLRAEVRSVSAVGEQYVDLQPRSRSGPYLESGAVIPSSAVTVPQRVAPMMHDLSDAEGGVGIDGEPVGEDVDGDNVVHQSVAGVKHTKVYTYTADTLNLKDVVQISNEISRNKGRDYIIAVEGVTFGNISKATEMLCDMEKAGQLKLYLSRGSAMSAIVSSVKS